MGVWRIGHPLAIMWHLPTGPNFTSQGLGPDPIPFGFSAGDLPVPLEGSFALRVYSLTTGGEGFSQVINLSPGSTYTITAQVKKNLWNGSWTVDGLWEVYIDGAVVTTWPVANQNIWETRSVTFTAAVAATTIGFRGRSLGPGYASLAIDDIRFDTPLEHDEDLPADEQGQFAAPLSTGSPGTLLYPNPAKNKFTLHVLPDEGPVWMRIYNTSGQTVAEQYLEYGNHEIDAHGLEPGLYWVKWGYQSQLLRLLHD